MMRRSRGKQLAEAIDARLVLHNFLYEVPGYADTLPYLLGAITLSGLVILIVTGILLGQFYAPDPAAANTSIRAIMADVPGGEILRGIHHWAAHLTMIVLFLHLGRVFATGAYRFPREANWGVGIALLATMLAFFFTGTVLRWDQEAIEALEHNVAFAQLLGVFGGWFSPTFAGHIPLLTRLYMAHVSLLPLILFILFSGHLYLVRQHGFSPHPGGPTASQSRYTFAHHLIRAGGYGCIILGLALTLAVLLPPGEGAAAGFRHRGDEASVGVPARLWPGKLVRPAWAVGRAGTVSVASGGPRLGPGPHRRLEEQAPGARGRSSRRRDSN
jgi:quinol-cytochrome oxidoreductase complex cytochrome b subunit